jgi:ABC-type nitrate/sulfonate/bicarbonate transport system permease component
VTAASAAASTSARARPRGSRLRRWRDEYAAPGALLALLGLAWEASTRAFEVPPWILPAPSQIALAAVQAGGTLPAHLRTTIIEALTGLAIAATLGVAVALLMASSGLARRVVYPLVVISQNVPLIVLAPLLVIWFGFGMLPKVLIVALVGFFPIAVGMTEALLRADPEMIDLVRSMGASRMQVLRTVRLPGALPAFFAGLRISATYAIFGAVIGEWVGASSGLGLFITRSQHAYRTDQVFVAVIVIAALSIALFYIVGFAARLAMPWQAATTEESS